MPENNSDGSQGTNGSSTDYHDFAVPPSDADRGSADEFAITNSAFEFDLFEQLNNVRDIAELEKRVWALVRGWGFSDFTFSVSEHVGDRESHLITMPSDIRKMYVLGGFHEYDMVTGYIKTATASIYDALVRDYVASAPFENDIIRQNREMFRMLKSYGYYCSYVAPAKAGTGKGNVSLSLQIQNKSPLDLQRQVNTHQRHIQHLLQVLNFVVSNKFVDYFFPTAEYKKVDIGPRPMQLLTTIATEDLTLAEAANKLCISIHTANQHIAAARKAFDAHTTNGAIAHAVRAGQIKI